MVIFVLIAFIAIIITIDFAFQYRKKKRSKIKLESSIKRSVFNEDSVAVAKGIYYDKTHTWAFMEKNGTVKIGIDDFLLHVIGPLGRVEMKNWGEKVQKGEPLFSVFQKGKKLSIKSPISGTIRFRNRLLVDDTSLLNYSPLQEGWIYIIEPSNWQRESQFLMWIDGYKEWLKNEFTRLKDFIASNRKINNSEYFPVLLQDGGELQDHLLSYMEPEIWEDFQTKFIDASK